MNTRRTAFHLVVNPADLVIPAKDAAAVAASTYGAVDAAPNALAVCDAAAADAVADAAEDLFGEMPNLPPLHALNAGSFVGDTVVISVDSIEYYYNAQVIKIDRGDVQTDATQMIVTLPGTPMIRRSLI